MKLINVAIRADSSTALGYGHLMRCLSLADFLIQNGANVFFITRELPGSIWDKVRQKGYEVVLLPSPSGDDSFLRSNEIEVKDAIQTIQVLTKRANKIDWLVVDHYALGAAWETQLKPHTKKIMVIDDLADRKHACDLLLDQNYFVAMEQRYLALVPQECELFLGPRYALLRNEFVVARNYARVRNAAVNNLLIFMGGSDPVNATQLTLNALVCFKYSGTVNVVIGSANPNKDKIKSFCEDNNYNYYCQVDNISELMVQADLAIGSGGSSIWERCCLGLPSVVVAIANNQIKVAEAAQKNGLLCYLGDIREMSFSVFVTSLQKALTDKTIINKISQQCFYAVDGLGGKRLAAQLCK